MSVLGLIFWYSYLCDTLASGAREHEGGAEAGSQRGRRDGEGEGQVGSELALWVGLRVQGRARVVREGNVCML